MTTPTVNEDAIKESPYWPTIMLVTTGLLLTFCIYQNKWGTNEQCIKLLGVIATLGIFSILYQENPVFRFLEHIFIGLATGWSVVFTWFQLVKPKWYLPFVPGSWSGSDASSPHGQWWLIFALLIGLLFFTVYFPKISWMNRFAISVLMGWAAGNAFQQFMGTLAPQLVAAFRPAVTTYAVQGLPNGDNYQVGNSLWLHPYTLIAFIVLVCTFAYFFFSLEHKYNWVRQPAKAGRYLLMITLGIIFGTTVMSRFTLLIGRLEFLRLAFTDWWGMLSYWISHLMR